MKESKIEEEGFQKEESQEESKIEEEEFQNEESKIEEEESQKEESKIEEEVQSEIIIKENDINILDFINNPKQDKIEILNTIISVEKYPPDKYISGTSKIDLGECEDILRKEYNISKDRSLIIKKKDVKIEGKATKKVEFEIYDDKGNLLDFNYCKSTSLQIATPLGHTEGLKLEEGERLKDNGVDIYNSKDEFFNDYCNNNNVGEKADIPITDRINKFMVKVELCDDECEYKGIEYETKLVYCECNININNNNTENKEYSLGFFKKILNNINYKVFSCSKYIFEKKNYKSNYGFLFSFSIFILLNILAFFHFMNTTRILNNKILTILYLPKSSPVNKKYYNDLIIYDITPKRIISKNDYSNQKTIKNNDYISSTKRNLIKSKTKHKGENLVHLNNNNNNKDYDDMYYFEAIKEDNRNFLSISYTFFASKIDLLRILFFPKSFDIFYITLSVLLLCLIIDFTINALLFSDEIMSKKYNNQNKLNFWTSGLLAIIANIFGNIISWFITKLSEYSSSLELIKKEVNNNNKILFTYSKMYKIIKIRLLIYFIIQFIITLICVYYLIIFCSLYHYSQRALFKNYLLGLLLSLLYIKVITFIIALLRYISLKCKHIKIFLISQYLNEHF